MARLKTVGFWLLKFLLAALFIFGGGAKLAGVPALVELFERTGFGQWLRILTALLELVGAVLLLWTPTTAFGALLLATVGLGAFFAQLLVLNEDVIHTIALILVLGAIVWTHRDQLHRRRL
jgi:putative oxidoreductase